MSIKTNYITKDEMHEALEEVHSITLFDKRSARLLINCTAKGLKVWFSVYNKGSLAEEVFDLMADAASLYNIS